MADQFSQVAFNQLWAKLPTPERQIWSETFRPARPSKPSLSWREIIELLCGALWHLEFAARIDQFHPSLSNQQDTPWKEWLESRRSESSQDVNARLFPIYLEGGSPNPPLHPLLQSMLLADSALRIAGTRWLLYDRSNLQNRYEVLHNLPQDHAKDSPLQRQVRIVLAFRDSFMHGEMPDRGGHNFREKWINNQLADAPYSLEVIAKACHHVWSGLAEIVNKAA